MRLSKLVDGIYLKDLPLNFRDFEVKTISCDSREEQQNGLFVALSGFKFDGKDFIKGAIDRGARVIACRHPEAKPKDLKTSLDSSLRSE